MLLNKNLEAFKKRVRNAPTIQRRIVEPVEPASAGIKREGPNEDDATSGKRKKTSIVFSQPANTGSGSHFSTQLVHAVEYIKRFERPVSFQELEDYMSVKIKPLVPLLKSIDRVQINEAAKTASYISVYNIYSAEALLKYLREQTTFQGVPIKKLKDGWSGCLDAIEQLEKENQILVLRTKKENIPRFVWANRGGPLGGVDKEFTDLWSQIKVPSAAELPGKLERAGLIPTSVDPATIKKNTTKVSDRKQKKPRKGKITNVHMRGILRDYGS